MEITEVRIGNLISENGKVVLVKSLQWGQGINQEAGRAAPDVQPLPLDAAWLERLQFTLDKEQSEGEPYRLYTMGSWDAYVYEGYISIELSSGAYEPPQDITYVHQLQNLYFALTGRELEVHNAAEISG